MLNILVTGAAGKMGRETVAAIEAEPDFKLVGAVKRGDDLTRCIQDMRPDIVIDFTAPEIVFDNAQKIIAANVHPVIGTTGLTPEQFEVLRKACDDKKLGGIVAPNFSIGVMLLQKMAMMAAEYFPDVEIIEMHHPMKKDAPSGTALKTAKAIDAARKRAPSAIATAPAAALGDRTREVPIHSVRLPGFMAHETAIFAAPYETLTIRHDSLDRKCFMPGVVLACKKVMMIDDMVYGLEAIL
jgi:4-hydroxy-tetrahydrodipicolinate reductase